MDSDGVALLEAGIAAYNRGDFDEALRHFTEDVVWNAPPDFLDVGRIEGHEGLRSLWEMGARIFGEVALEPGDYREGNACFYCRIRFSGQAGGGMQVSQNAFAVVRTDGRLIHQMDYFRTSEEALKSAGLSA